MQIAMQAVMNPIISYESAAHFSGVALESALARILSIPQVILRYPPGADAKNPIAITKGDYARLDKWQFLNDNLVDWYLRYVKHKVNDRNILSTHTHMTYNTKGPF